MCCPCCPGGPLPLGSRSPRVGTLAAREDGALPTPLSGLQPRFLEMGPSSAALASHLRDRTCGSR